MNISLKYFNIHQQQKIIYTHNKIIQQKLFLSIVYLKEAVTIKPNLLWSESRTLFRHNI